MSKELQALKSLKKLYVQAIKQTKYPKFTELEQHKFDIIETALKRLEEIDKNMFLNNKQIQDNAKKDEILRIITSKRIDFDKLHSCANAYEYNTAIIIENNEQETTRQHITQTEYDTLEKMGLIY